MHKTSLYLSLTHLTPFPASFEHGGVRACVCSSKRLLDKASQNELQESFSLEDVWSILWKITTRCLSLPPSLPNSQAAYTAIFIEGTKGMKEMEMQFLLLMICNAHVWTSQGRSEFCGRTPSFLLRAPAHLPLRLPRIQQSHRPRFTTSRRRKREIPLNLPA